ncbi:MAG: hypothetical protein ACFFDI_01085 [Promethearchaeota archaeon]
MRKQKRRTHYTYVFKVGRKIKHGGMTRNLEEREQQHKQQWPRGHILQVGRKKTKKGALAWEKKHGYS